MKKLFPLLWASEDILTISICILDLYTGIFIRLNYSFKIPASSPFFWKKLFMCYGAAATAGFFWGFLIIIININIIELWCAEFAKKAF